MGHNKIILLFFFRLAFGFSFKFCSVLGESHMGRGWKQGDRETSGIRVYDVKSKENL